MKYEKVIRDKFKQYKLKPRKNQVELISKILYEYLDNNKKHVVLSASTGSGKSIVAVIVADCLHEIKNEILYRNRKSFILMHNNTLVEQYRNAFKNKSGFMQIIGARNYECKLLYGTAEDCILTKIKKRNGRIPSKCNNCEYIRNKEKMNKIPHVITNYSFYFVSQLWAHSLKRRLITIFDEAQIVNDVFCNNICVDITKNSINKIIKIIKGSNIDNASKYIKAFEDYRSDILYNRVREDTYLDFLKMFFLDVEDLADIFDDEAEHYYNEDNIEGYKVFNKASKYFSGYVSRYNSFIDEKYEHIVDIGKDKISIKPIFIEKMFDQLQNSDYCLFMSATITDFYIYKTMNIDSEDIAFIKADPAFKPESKELIFVNHNNYNYRNMSNEHNLREMNKIILNIIKEHEHENGIILTPSFKINRVISQYLINNNVNIKIFEQIQGESLKKFLNSHKNDKENSVLISPSLFEGIDLPDNQSRWQILVKAPFASLADKRIKAILDRYPRIYKLNTIFKIVQAPGRSTRNEDDYSVTYTLDRNIYRLYNDADNFWKDEFKIQTVKG